MADTYPTFRVAAVQAVSPFLDREAGVARACELIREAGANGARLVVFPEGFIPSHPNWFHHHVATGPASAGFLAELFKNAVEVPGPATDAIGQAARDAGAYVVMGICEKRAGTLGTMFNTQVYFGPDGALIGKHQKLMPTAAERLAHTGGHGDTFGTFTTEFGPMSSLICGENNNPLAVFSLAAQHTRVHAMSWPPYVSPTAAPVRQIGETATRNFAEVAGCFVVSAFGALDRATLDRMGVADSEAEALLQPGVTGGSMIVGPNGQMLAGPMGSEEGILYADCDIELAVRRKLSRDYAGHYNRADVFQLTVNTAAPALHRRGQAETPSPERADGRDGVAVF